MFSSTKVAGSAPDNLRPGPDPRRGLLYGVGAYTMWGIVPLYFRAVSEIAPWIVLCHRVVWSSLLLAMVVTARREWKCLWPIVRSGRNVLFLPAGAVLIAVNWLVFIYAISTQQLLQASLGYFINPLLSIALGLIFLRERLRGWQWFAVLVAAIGVANLALRSIHFPWIAISLAGSFGFYSLVRKKIEINSLHGLFVETALLLPVAIGTLWFHAPGGGSPATLALLSLSGIVTAVPLLLFGAAVRRLTLSAIGFLQYIGPTLQFLLALFLFHEPLDRGKLSSFILCWLAIGVYVADSIFTREPQPLADRPE